MQTAWVTDDNLGWVDTRVIEVQINGETIGLTWEDFEERVRAGRVPPEALVRWEPLTGDAWVEAGELETYKSLHNEALWDWQRSLRHGPVPILTALLVGFQVRVWWLAHIPSWNVWLETRFTKWTAFTLEDGEVWRILTMGLLHTDGIHLVMNMLWLGYTAWNLEAALGRKNLLCLYFGSVTAGSLLSMWGAPESPSLGASGGVFGLIAASVVFGFARPNILPVRSLRFFGFAMLPFLLLMFLSGVFNARTDNWCHLGGLLAGGLLAGMLDPPPLERAPGHNTRVRGAVLLLIGGVLTTLALAGPAFVSLADADEVRTTALTARSASRRVEVADPGRYRSLRYDVPLGWTLGSSFDGLHGFRSPAGGRA